MRAKRILQRGAFAPEEFARVQQAFDLAWAAIAPSVDERDHERRRELLATIVLSLAAARGDLDAEEISQMAIRLAQIVNDVA